MNKPAAISPIIRVASGVIGLLGFAAIAFNAVQEDSFEADVFLFVSFFAGFIFLFVAFFGKYPWDGSGPDE